jgi:phage terminase small subunit
MADLTDKQELFISEYLKDLNAKQAAIRAGYSEKTAEQQASRLLSKVKVQEELNKRQAKVAQKCEIDAQWVLKNLKKVYERCMQEEGVYDRDGNFQGVFEFEASGAIRALELLGKHQGMFNTIKLAGDPEGAPIKTENKTPVVINITERIAQMLNKDGAKC